METNRILYKFNEVTNGIRELTQMIRECNKSNTSNNRYLPVSINNIYENNVEYEKLIMELNKFINNASGAIGKYTNEEIKNKIRSFRVKALVLKEIKDTDKLLEKVTELKIEWKEFLLETKSERKSCKK